MRTAAIMPRVFLVRARFMLGLFLGDGTCESGLGLFPEVVHGGSRRCDFLLQLHHASLEHLLCLALGCVLELLHQPKVHRVSRGYAFVTAWRGDDLPYQAMSMINTTGSLVPSESNHAYARLRPSAKARACRKV